MTAKPHVTTQYRLRFGKNIGSPVRVAVAPNITVRLVRGTNVHGEIAPAVGHVPVTIQRRTPPGWKDVATVLTTNDGGFRVQLEPHSGSYRARVDALPGLTAGVSRTLEMASG